MVSVDNTTKADLSIAARVGMVCRKSSRHKSVVFVTVPDSSAWRGSLAWPNALTRRTDKKGD